MKLTRRPACTCGGRHHHLVGLGLGALAVVLASTGTAVAVAVTSVQIVDPKSPSRAARVESGGRLTVAEPRADLAVAGILKIRYENNFVTSPTTATLAISRVTLTNPQVNRTNTTSETEVFLRRVTVGPDGTCATGAYVDLAIYTLEPGDDIVDVMPAPIVVAPVRGQAFCLSLYVFPTSSDGSTYFYQYYSFSGYVVSGTYTGIGVNANAGTAATTKTRSR